jgi:hypothetical protein
MKEKKIMKKFKNLLFLLPIIAIMIVFSSCSDTVTNIINNTLSNEVAAKDRLDSAISQATRKYGPNTKLVLILGKNVKSNGKTDISTITLATNPDSIGAWLYVFRDSANSSLRVYTPNPVPTANDCWELTALFSTNTLLNLVQDTSARNILAGVMQLITTTNISITTPIPNLVNSDVSLGYANTTNPIIKFNSSYVPDTSSLNGNAFFSTGTNKTTNMMLMPAAGTLNLPNYISGLTGFPADMWIVNYKKTNSISLTENLILGTVVQSNQNMSIPFLGLTSKVINISKYVSE